MSPRPNRRPLPDVAPYCVRISDPGDIAAGIPQLLGFHPRESVVLIGLGGPRHRIGLTVRVDIPPLCAAADLTRTLARTLTGSVLSGRPDAVVVAVVSEAPDEPGSGGADLPHRALLRELTLSLTDVGLPLRQALLVRNGRWWSYDCADACCRPGAGTALPGGVTALEAASVASGIVVETSRQSLELRIRRDPARGAALDDCLRAVGDWAAVAEAVGLCAPGPATAGVRLPDPLLVRVVAALQDLELRDRALGLALGEEAAAAQALWTECTRRAPEPLDAAPATLLAVSAWLQGDGAMANIALDRALTSDPGYRLAGLLAPALEACLHPAELRRLIRDSTRPVPESSRP
jgi:uncharacterized protein DUF4192